MFRYFVNVKGCCDNCNNALKNNNEFRPVPEPEKKVQRCKYNKRYHGDGGGMQFKAAFQVSFQKKDKTALQATARALYMQPCLRRASEHVLF